MLNPSLFSSQKEDWVTPQYLYDALNAEFVFDCDVAADAFNAKHYNYFSKTQDALKQKWRGVCWCNPPYGRGVDKWVAKAHAEAERGVVTVMLLPARTDTKYFHDYIYGQHEVRFLRGRLKFKGATNSAPFPSMIVIFKKEKEK